jgi:hypothetical protein
MKNSIQFFMVMVFILSFFSSAAAEKVVVVPLGSKSGEKFISLPVETAVINNGAAYEINGGADLSGMAFPNSGFPRFSTGFSLPPNYIPGGDIVVYITWGNSSSDATNCGVRLRANGVSAFRPNVNPLYTNGVFTGSDYFDGSRITLTMPSVSQEIHQTIMTIKGKNTIGDTLFEPGDNIVMRIAREDTDSLDTCLGKLFILGLYATY